MRQESVGPERRPRFDPAKDWVTILWSDTTPGAFCAAVLRAILQHNRPFRKLV